ncbi:MAG TPA: valine--tRNA ligase [Chitinophagales bacterium]|nr:valine--tRNA ligase [Chitinophagales bacterium]
MELPTKYDPKLTEDKWYKYWLDLNLFHSEPDEREPFTIVIPPPNVTGVLHMGHMLNNTIQDILIRKARMEGKNACWVPGTDHASIATEAKVVQMLRERGIKKSDLTRDEFLKYAWEWKEKYGGIILEQLKKLGASCDWQRTRFTMEDKLSDAVIEVFIDLHKKGLIYRGLRMINWDPSAKTTLSNEEVLYTEENSQLCFVKYMIKGSDEFLPVATVRTETIMGDVAVCVNPNDERYKHLVGKTVIVPLVNREVPVIADDYVDIEFGTGALKITPAHDINDYEIGKKFNLEVIDCFNEDGTVAEAAQVFVGLDRFKARKLATEQLEADGLLIKKQDYLNKVGRSERTNAIIEPRLSLQWFVDMKKFFEKNPQVLNDVMNDDIHFYPEKLKNTYKHWIDNVRDWCISRQLWWGQRIPAWYDEQGNLVAVAKTAAEAEKASGKQNLKQDEDVLDTWFSSWLWPISVFDGFENPDNKDINYYYPTNDLVTAPEIMFFWVMRMIMAGYEWRGEKPFKNVYYTGIVRDKLRRKMSKSLGNSPDPLDLIEQYGADGVRLGMLLCSPAGNDILFDEKLCEQGRNFSNKLWNAFRLVKQWEVYEGENSENKVVIEWLESKISKTIVELNTSYSDYRLSEALMTLYKLIWDDFCSWYLELIKPDYQKPIDSYTYNKTVELFETLLKLLHPIMPFVTEEIWHLLATRTEGASICVAECPKAGMVNDGLIAQAELTFELITNIREIRARASKKNTETVDAFYNGSDAVSFSAFDAKIIKLARLAKLEQVKEDVAGSKTFIAKGYKFFVVTGEQANEGEEREKLLKELEYTKGFLASVDKKLSNEKFVASAKPEVVENEKKKRDDALSKIAMLEQSLAG